MCWCAQCCCIFEISWWFVIGFPLISEDKLSSATDLTRLQGGKVRALIYLNSNCQRYTVDHLMIPILDTHILKEWLTVFKWKTTHNPTVWTFGSWENMKKLSLSSSLLSRATNKGNLLDILVGLPMIHFIWCWCSRPAYLEASLQWKLTLRKYCATIMTPTQKGSKNK